MLQFIVERLFDNRARLLKSQGDEVMVRASLLAIISIVFFIRILSTSSATESVVWVIIGISSLLGVATWGYSSKEVLQIVKSKL